MNKKKIKECLEKYIVNKRVIALSIIIAVICSLIYIYLEFRQNQISIETLVTPEKAIDPAVLIKVSIFKVVQTIALMLFSGAATSILSIIIIEVKEKNSIVSDLIIKDVFSSDEFYKMVPYENKEKVLNLLEKDLYFDDNKILADMFSSTRETICKSSKKQNFYFEKCEINIKCKICEGYIEKTILKTLKIKSYKTSHKEKKYQFLGCSYQDDFSEKPIILKSLSIAGKKYEPNDRRILVEICNVEETLSNKIGYDKKQKYYWSKDVDLSSKKSCEVKVEYITRVPLEDNLYSFRTQNPCKSFSFTFDLIDSKGYDIKTIAFGFVDDANSTPNTKDDKKSVRINFDNWIFPHDGVAVVINKV